MKKEACRVSEVHDVIATRACHRVRCSCGRIRTHMRCSFLSGVRPHSFEPEYGPTQRDINTVEYIDCHDGRQITGEDLSDENENRVGNTAWCRCSRCSVIPNVAECLCCQEVAELGYRVEASESDL